MNRILDTARNRVRLSMHFVAKMLNTLSGGRITPDAITIVGLLAHIPIAYLIATGRFMWAAVLLLIFGLFDTLDGELARLQKRAGSAGMVLDASTDRMKEVILYIGIAASFVHTANYRATLWAVAACGGSLLVSYVKAKGETALAGLPLSANEKNRFFQDGFLRFEIRMLILLLGLVFNQLIIAVAIIAILSWFTALQRLIFITRKLKAL